MSDQKRLEDPSPKYVYFNDIQITIIRKLLIFFSDDNLKFSNKNLLATIKNLDKILPVLLKSVFQILNGV